MLDGATVTEKAYTSSSEITANTQVFTEIASASKLFDGNSGTNAAITDGQTVVVTGKELSRVSLLTVACDTVQTAPKGLRLEASANGTDWKTLIEETNVTFLFNMFLFGRTFLALFTTESAVIDAGMERIRIMGFSYAFSCFMDCSIAASRGIGKSIPPTIIIILGSCVFRVIWFYTVFAHFQTISSLYLLYIFSWGITGFAEVLFFAVSFRKIRA